MITLRPGLLVQAHMIVAIELSKDNGNPCIDVHTPDGQYWSIGPECGYPINMMTLIALGNEIDRQCREIGAAGVVSDQVKRMIDQRIDPDTFQRGEPMPNRDWPSAFGKGSINASRDLDDEIPF